MASHLIRPRVSALHNVVFLEWFVEPLLASGWFMEREAQLTITLAHSPLPLLVSSTRQLPHLPSTPITHLYRTQNLLSKETAQETPSPKWHVVKSQSRLVA